MLTSPVVDANVHLVADDPLAYPYSRVRSNDWPAGASLTVEKYDELRAIANVRTAVFVCPIRTHGFDNTYARDSAQRVGQAVWVGNLDPFGLESTATLRRSVEQDGMAGVRLITRSPCDPAEWIHSAAPRRLWAEAGALDISVSALTWTLPAAHALRRMLEDFPDIEVVLYSMGSPTFDPAHFDAERRALEGLAEHPNLHLVLSPLNLDALARTTADVSGFLAHLVEIFTSSRLMWGSFSMFRGARLDDGPTLRDVQARFADAFSFLPQSDLALIMGGGAMQLYPGLAS